MRIEATWIVQRAVVAQEYQRLAPWQTALWLALLTACVTPGMPLDDGRIKAQVQAVWGTGTQTWRNLYP